MVEEAVEAVNLRVRGSGPGARPGLPSYPLQDEDASPAVTLRKPVWFDAEGAIMTPCYVRERLSPGNRFDGPGLVFQYDSTVVITPGWQARVDQFANLWMERT
jgi:N-methylhydantoinase A